MLDDLTPILFIGGCQDLYLAYFFVERNLYIRQLPYIVLAKVEDHLSLLQLTFASLLLIPFKEKLIAQLIPALVAERQS